MDVTKEIAEFIIERFEIEDDGEFSHDVNLFDYGFVDSLDAVEIIAFIEEHWKIEITQRDIVMYPMNSVNEIAAVVKSKLN